MYSNMLFISEPFPQLAANGLWKEYYKAANFSIGRVADWSLMVISPSPIELYDKESDSTIGCYVAWHIDKEFAEKIINNNLLFTTTIVSNTNKDEVDLVIRIDGGLQQLTAIRDEVQNGTRECLIDAELEEMLKTYLDKEKMKANREQNKANLKTIEPTKQPWYVQIFKGPLRRILVGLLGLSVGGIFPPLFALAGFLCIPFFFWGEYAEQEWTETSKTEMCDKCKTEGKIKVVKVTNRMYVPFLRRITAIPYMKTYYAVCEGCVKKHLDDESIGQILAMARTDMATVRALTKAEYEELIKK